MSNQIDDRNQPAFPSGKSETPGYENSLPYYEGFTRQEYAAIHLKQPTSGTPWLDEMILAAKRDELAGQVLAALLGNPGFSVDCEQEKDVPKETAKMAYEAADAMLAARKETQ